MIELHGKLLIFDKPDSIGNMFPKDCKLHLPDTVPVTWEFNKNSLEDVIGIASIIENTDHISCNIKLHNFSNDILKALDDEIGIGGYYTSVHSSVKNGIRTIDRATLRMVGLTMQPADNDLKAVVVQKED